MQLGHVDNYGNLLRVFRIYDTNKNGYISKEEDPEVKRLDVDGDDRASLWELMVGVNAQRGKVYFTGKEIETIQESIKYMPNVSPGNILHLVLAINRRFICKKDMQQIYALFNFVLQKIKQEEFDKLSPEGKMEKVLKILIDKDECNFKIINCLLPNIKGKSADVFGLYFLKRKFNCVSFAYTILVIGQEMNWPLSLIELPSHVAIHWEAGKDSFLFERHRGVVKDYNIYKDFYKLLSDESIKSGAYLRPISESEALANMYLWRARVKYYFELYWGAYRDLSTAISLAPLNVHAYHGLGATYRRLENDYWFDTTFYKKQIEQILDKIYRLDPDFHNRPHLQKLPECED